jgi:hypothetical protein
MSTEFLYLNCISFGYRHLDVCISKNSNVATLKNAVASMVSPLVRVTAIQLRICKISIHGLETDVKVHGVSSIKKVDDYLLLPSTTLLSSHFAASPNQEVVHVLPEIISGWFDMLAI